MKKPTSPTARFAVAFVTVSALSLTGAVATVSALDSAPSQGGTATSAE
jgi:hypothetical protein